MVGWFLNFSGLALCYADSITLPKPLAQGIETRKASMVRCGKDFK
jgi:hypothetical protein